METVPRRPEEDLGEPAPSPRFRLGNAPSLRQTGRLRRNESNRRRCRALFPLGFLFRADIQRRVRRLLLFIVAFLAAAFPGFATDISPNLAANHIGQTVTVCGVVSQVYVNKQNGVFLNFGGVYPHLLFSAVVRKRRSPELLADGDQWLRDLEGKDVAVTGEIQIYDGKPEIVIRKRENLRILEAKIQETKIPEVKK